MQVMFGPSDVSSEKIERSSKYSSKKQKKNQQKLYLTGYIYLSLGKKSKHPPFINRHLFLVDIIGKILRCDSD